MPDRATRRRRPSPEMARAEILEAARELFLTRPAPSITVAAIMQRTTLARPSFYDHFASRGQVVADLVQPVIATNRAILARWSGPTDEPRAALAATIAQLVSAWHEQGALLTALAHASHTDQDAAAAYRAFSADSVSAVAGMIRMELAAETIQGLDPEETALALVLMNRTYLSTRLRDPQPPHDDTLTATLVEIWARVLWPAL